MNYNKICVFDFETDGSDPTKCSPVQLAAIMIDPLRLEIIPNSSINLNFKPEVLAKDENYKYTTDILEFHARVKGCLPDDVLKLWHTYPQAEHSWKLFIDYLDKYHTRSSKKSQFSAPIAAGYNINRFDLNIIDRLSQTYGNINKEGRNNIFYPRDMIDGIHLMFYWFEHNQDIKSYSLDSVRTYFGMSKVGAHDAMKDVLDTAEIIIRFMRLHRNLATKVQFQQAFGQVNA
jgi:DNA polymerase III epsilon subunit-like protein